MSEAPQAPIPEGAPQTSAASRRIPTSTMAAPAHARNYRAAGPIFSSRTKPVSVTTQAQPADHMLPAKILIDFPRPARGERIESQSRIG